MMVQLKHQGHDGPQRQKRSQFRFLDTLQERRYIRTIQKLAHTGQRIQALECKRPVYSELVSHAGASGMNEEVSNWKEAKEAQVAYNSCRKKLRHESTNAAFHLFSKTMFDVGRVVGLWIGVAYGVAYAMQVKMNLPAVGGSGLLLTAVIATLLTWNDVSSGSQKFLDAVAADIAAQARSLDAKKQNLIRKLHNLTSSRD